TQHEGRLRIQTQENAGTLRPLPPTQAVSPRIEVEGWLIHSQCECQGYSNLANRTASRLFFANRDFQFQKSSQLFKFNLTANLCIALSSSRNAVSISSARTMNRFPSRCASAIQIVRPSRLTADTQPKLQPVLWRLSAMISQSFTRWDSGVLLSTPQW